MKKYDIPEIKINRFLCESVVTISAEPEREYIQEVNSLQTFLGDSPDQYQRRMENFNTILSFNSGS